MILRGLFVHVHVALLVHLVLDLTRVLRARHVVLVSVLVRLFD